jgi:uncharacterized protein (DUF2141 family)
MHSFEANFTKIIFFTIFLVFLFINHAFSDHLTVKVTGFKDASSPIYIWGYDRKFYFDNDSAPLFMVGERDINNFNQINLKAFPHLIVGLFAFQDIDQNGIFSKDFKGDPLEPYGFSLNPVQDYQEIVFEDIAFDMNKFEKIEINLNN